MMQTLATMIFLILGVGALAVIVAAVADDWSAIRGAFGFGRMRAGGALPARIRRIASPRRTRMLRVSPQPASLRAAA